MFKNKKPHKLSAFMLLFVCMQLHAQNMSVGEMIAKSKEARVAEMQGRQPPKETGTVKKQKAPAPLSKPKVWSITGTNDDFEAVLVYQQKVYVAHSVQLPSAVGGWQITKITGQHVWVKAITKKGIDTPIFTLEAPEIDTSLDTYAQALNLQMAVDEKGDLQSWPAAPNQVSQLAAQPAPLPPAQRPPVPSGLPKQTSK